MKHEGLNFRHQVEPPTDLDYRNIEAETINKDSEEKTEVGESTEETKVVDSEEFDLGAFFSDSDESNDSRIEQDNEVPSNEAVLTPMPDLLVSLRDDANESIATFTIKVKAETFAAGASLTSSVFSTLGSLVGSCGVFCAHSFNALGQAGSALSGASGLAGGLNMPSFSVDDNGHFHLDGNIDSLSRATGISKGDLLTGKFSAENILTSFFSGFGEGICMIFGFGLVGTFIDCLFDCFLPSGAESGELPMAA